MLPLTVLLSLVAATAAQNYSFPKGFDVGSIELATRSSWCTAQRSTCPKICSGATDENSCEPQSLTFSCKCDNGTAADVEPYMQTVPFFVCQANFGNCIAAHPDDADGQDKCKKDNQCGTLNATETAAKSESESSSSSSSSESSSPSSSSTATLASSHQADNSDSTAASSSPSTTANAAAALRMAQEHSTGVFATALLVVMGLIL